MKEHRGRWAECITRIDETDSQLKAILGKVLGGRESYGDFSGKLCLINVNEKRGRWRLWRHCRRRGRTIIHTCRLYDNLIVCDKWFGCPNSFNLIFVCVSFTRHSVLFRTFFNYAKMYVKRNVRTLNTLCSYVKLHVCFTEPTHGDRHRRVTCDLLSVSTKIGSLNHAACAAHCLIMMKGYRGGRCIDGVCNCRR